MDYTNLALMLSKTDLNLLYEVVNQIAAVSEVSVMKPANTSLVMMGAKDSVQEMPFYLGEVLITQCAVRVDEKIGFGFAMGDDPGRAYCLAVIEAAVYGDSAQKGMVDKFIISQTQLLQKEQEREYAAVRQTKVRFDSMEEA